MAKSVRVDIPVKKRDATIRVFTAIGKKNKAAGVNSTVEPVIYMAAFGTKVAVVKAQLLTS
ncbi:MAG: hypothetical protein V4615_18125 [Bacteroidota bacterium]